MSGLRVKTYSDREFLLVLKHNGYRPVSSRGDHKKYKNDNNDTIITSPNINKMVARRMIKEHHLVIPRKIKKQ